jgi:hypothetical protein
VSGVRVEATGNRQQEKTPYSLLPTPYSLLPINNYQSSINNQQSIMTTFLTQPFVLIHLAGLAVVPISLVFVWLGLAVCEPMPFWDFKLIIVAITGVIPILYMQFKRPFYIYNILVFSLKPEILTEDQRKILTLLKTTKARLFATVITSILMLLSLALIYKLIPLASTLSFLANQWSITGFFVAIFAFLVSNLFLQVPVSLLSIIFTPKDKFEQVSPLTPQSIKQEFTLIGFQLKNMGILTRGLG